MAASWQSSSPYSFLNDGSNTAKKAKKKPLSSGGQQAMAGTFASWKPAISPETERIFNEAESVGRASVPPQLAHTPSWQGSIPPMRGPSGETGPNDYERLQNPMSIPNGASWQQRADARRATNAANERGNANLQQADWLARTTGSAIPVSSLSGGNGVQGVGAGGAPSLRSFRDWTNANMAARDAAMRGEVPQPVGPWQGPSGNKSAYPSWSTQAALDAKAAADPAQAARVAAHQDYIRGKSMPQLVSREMVTAKAQGQPITPEQAQYNVMAKSGQEPQFALATAAGHPSWQAIERQAQAERDKALAAMAMHMPVGTDLTPFMDILNRQGGNNGVKPFAQRRAALTSAEQKELDVAMQKESDENERALRWLGAKYGDEEMFIPIYRQKFKSMPTAKGNPNPPGSKAREKELEDEAREKLKYWQVTPGTGIY